MRNINKYSNFLNFQDKKDYNFSNKHKNGGISPTTTNVYSMLLLNKVVSTQKLNTLNLANNGYFFAKSTNIQKSCEVNPERLPIFAKRMTTKNLAKVQYTKVGYNKHTLYSLFKAMRRDRLFLNEKFYQNLIGKRAFTFFSSGMKHYNKEIAHIKKLNKYIEQQIWNVADRRNQYFLNVFDVSAYTYHKYVDVTKEKNENKYVKCARLFLDIWDTVDDYASYWYADYWYDANFPTNEPKKSIELISKEMKQLRDYETYYGMFKFREKMRKHLWRMRLGKTMYLNTFSKNATRVNFLKGAGYKYFGKNFYASTTKNGGGLLRFLYTKLLFPRNRVEAWKGYTKFNVFLTGVNDKSPENLIDSEGKPSSDYKFNFMRKLDKREISSASIASAQENVKVEVSGNKIESKIKILNKKIKNKRKFVFASFNKIKKTKRLETLERKKKVELVFFKSRSYTALKVSKIRSKFCKSTRKSTVFSNVRFYFNRLKLKTLLINAIFSSRRLTEGLRMSKSADYSNHFQKRFEEYRWLADRANALESEVIDADLITLEKSCTVFSDLSHIYRYGRRNSHNIGTRMAYNFRNFSKDFKLDILGEESTIYHETGIISVPEWLRFNRRKAKKAIKDNRKRVLMRAKVWAEGIHMLRVYSNTIKMAVLPLVFKKNLAVSKQHNKFKTAVSNISDLKKTYTKLTNLDDKNAQYMDFLETQSIVKKKHESMLKVFTEGPSTWLSAKFRGDAAKQQKYAYDTTALESKFIVSMAVRSKVNFNSKLKEAKVQSLRDLIIRTLIKSGATIKTINEFETSRDKIGFTSLLLWRQKSCTKLVRNLLKKTDYKKNYGSLFLVSAKKELDTFDKFLFKNYKKNSERLKNKQSIKGLKIVKSNLVSTRLYDLEDRYLNVSNKVQWDSQVRHNRWLKERERLVTMLEDYLGIISINNMLSISNVLATNFDLAAKLAKEKVDGMKVEKEEEEEPVQYRGWKEVERFKAFPFYEDFIGNYIDNWKAAAFALTGGLPKETRTYYSELFDANFFGKMSYERLGIILPEDNVRSSEVSQYMPKFIGRGVAFLHQSNPYNIDYMVPEDRSEVEKFQNNIAEFGELYEDVETLPALPIRASEMPTLEQFELDTYLIHEKVKKISSLFNQFKFSKPFKTWENGTQVMEQFLQDVAVSAVNHALSEDGTLNFTKKIVVGKLATKKVLASGWEQFVLKHQFHRDVHTQVGMRRFPETWYKPGRKKYPLKSQKKDWGLKISLASRPNIPKAWARVGTTTYDSSVVYYRHIGWDSWTRFFKKFKPLELIYRYGRDGDPYCDMPLQTQMADSRIVEDAVYEEYLADFSLLGHNWFDFIPMGHDGGHENSVEYGTNLIKFERERGRLGIEGYEKFYRSYRDTVHKWFKRIKPMITYSGIKTYYQYNSYIMKINTEIKTTRYKALFNNYNFAFKLDRPTFYRNMTHISYFKNKQEASYLSGYSVDIAIYRRGLAMLKQEYLTTSLSLKTGKYKFRKPLNNTQLFSESTEKSQTLRLVNGEYLGDSLGNVAILQMRAQNDSNFVMTNDQFKFINKVHRSTLKTYGRVKRLDIRNGLTTFVAKNAMWW